MEVIFVCAYQCYTPSGGPSCRTQAFGSGQSYTAAVANKDTFPVFLFLVTPSGSGCRPFLCRGQGYFFCLLLGATPVSPPGHECCRTDKDLFFVFYWVFVGYALSCEQRLIFWFFWVLVGSVYSCVANSRVLLYGV